MDRSEEDVVSGILRVRVGGIERSVPTLKIRHVEAWGRLLASEAEGKVPSEWTIADVGALSGHAATRLLDLAVAYDRTGALGGREWLADNADPAELYAAVVAMVGNAFPLVGDPAAMLGLMLLRSGVPSDPPSGTSGRSTSGRSPRTRSASASTRSS